MLVAICKYFTPLIPELAYKISKVRHLPNPKGFFKNQLIAGNGKLYRKCHNFLPKSTNTPANIGLILKCVTFQTIVPMPAKWWVKVFLKINAQTLTRHRQVPISLHHQVTN